MNYYIKEQNGEIAVCSSTKLPKNMDGVTVITYERYKEEQQKLEEAAAAQQEEEASEQDYLTALEVLGVSE